MRGAEGQRFVKSEEIPTFRGKTLMATGFVDRKGVLVVELINPGAPITSQMY